jgi:hypothetical protein
VRFVRYHSVWWFLATFAIFAEVSPFTVYLIAQYAPLRKPSHQHAEEFGWRHRHQPSA